MFFVFVGGVFGLDNVVVVMLLEGRWLLINGCLVFGGLVVNWMFGLVVLCILICGKVFCIVE